MLIKCQNEMCGWVGVPDDLRVHQETGLPAEECWLDACPACGRRAWEEIHDPTLADEIAAVEWKIKRVKSKLKPLASLILATVLAFGLLDAIFSDPAKPARSARPSGHRRAGVTSSSLVCQPTARKICKKKIKTGPGTAYE